MKMKALRLHKIGDFGCEEVEKPTPKGEELLIKVGACGICGSDLPRIYELGAHVFPITIGHEFSGIIEEVGDDKNKHLLGRKVAVYPEIPCMECVHCKTADYAQCQNYNYLGSRTDGAFAEYCLVPSAWNLVFSENEETSMEELCMVEPATVAQHAVRRAGLKAGETIVIIGAGPIGIMAARFAKIFAAGEVILLDISEEKIKFAQERGFMVLNSLESGTAEKIKALTDGRGADCVIEGTGTGAGFDMAVDCARAFGSIALLGNPHKDTTIKLATHSNILRKELCLRGVWNSYYFDLPINEWKYTVKMIDEGRLKVADLITHKANIENLKALFDGIYKKEITICKAIYSENA